MEDQLIKQVLAEPANTAFDINSPVLHPASVRPEGAQKTEDAEPVWVQDPATINSLWFYLANAFMYL
jgi:hypothetical protein